MEISIRLGSEYGREVTEAEAVQALRLTDGDWVHVTSLDGDGKPVFGVEAEAKPWRFGFDGEHEPPKVTWASIGSQPVDVVRTFAACLTKAADLASQAADAGRVKAHWETLADRGE